jgi:hypothetical protein
MTGTWWISNTPPLPPTLETPPVMCSSLRGVLFFVLLCLLTVESRNPLVDVVSTGIATSIDNELRLSLDVSGVLREVRAAVKTLDPDTLKLFVTPLESLVELVVSDSELQKQVNLVASKVIIAYHLDSGTTKKQSNEGSVTSLIRTKKINSADFDSLRPSFLVGLTETKPLKVLAGLEQLVLLMSQTPLESPTDGLIDDQLRDFERLRTGFVGMSNLARGQGATVVEDYTWIQRFPSPWWTGPLRVVYTVEETGALRALNITIDGEVFTPGSAKKQWQLARLQANTVSYWHHANTAHLAMHIWSEHVFSWARRSFQPNHPAYLLLLSVSEDMTSNNAMFFSLLSGKGRILDDEVYNSASASTPDAALSLLKHDPSSVSAWMKLEQGGWADPAEKPVVHFPYRDCLAQAWKHIGRLVDALVPPDVGISQEHQEDFQQIFNRDIGMSTWNEILRHYITNVLAHELIHDWIHPGRFVLLKGYDPRTDRDGEGAEFRMNWLQVVDPHDQFGDNLHLYAAHMPNHTRSSMDSVHRFRREMRRLFRTCSEMDAPNAHAWKSIGASMSR